jgi:XRE family transcriptional regulator, regulator of sulfur utilization
VPEDEERLLTTFGNRVRAARQERRMSQDELARATRLNRSYIGFIERGEHNPILTHVARLAKALGVTVADLVDDIDSP